MLVAALLVFVVLPVVALAWLPAPWLWITVLGALFLFLRVRPNRHRKRGLVFFYVGVSLIAFAGVETFYLFKSQRTTTQAADTGADDYTEPHEILGYAPLPGAKKHVRSEFEGELIYDVEYTIGNDGLRVEPPRKASPTEGSILFFGGSYTFGDGLADDATLPYRTAVLLDGRYRTRNFGFSGRGPHHMLAAVQHGLVDELVEEAPRYAIYFAIRTHITRVIRPMPWDPAGPRYRLAEDGSAISAGRFDDPEAQEEPPFGERLDLFVRRQLRKSYVLRTAIREQPEREREVDLWAAVVAGAGARLEAAYPGLEFHVILWDSPYVEWEPMRDALQARSCRVHLAGSILENLHDDPYAYMLSRHDRHPNAKAAALLAAYVAEEIVGPGPR